MLLLIYLGLFGIGFLIGRAYRRWKIMKARVRENNRRYYDSILDRTNVTRTNVTRILPDYNYVDRSKP